MSWSKSLLVVGIVLALIGGTSFASVTYSLDSGTSGGGITWGTGYLFSLNLFTTNFSANVLDQLQVAWGNLAPGTAAQVVLIELPNNNLSFPNNSRGTNILQDISTTVTAGEANGTSLTFDGNNTSYFLDPNNGNAPTTITNPTWTTYNITPTTITTPYFAVCTIVYDTDPGSVAPTLLDWGQGGSNSGGTNVPGPAISWLGFGGSSNSQYDLWFYNNFGGNQGTVEFFSGYGYFNNPFLIRAADTTGDSAPVTFWWYDVSNSATFNWNNSGSQNNWSTTGADGQGGVFPVGGAFPNRIDDIVNIGTANATIDLGGATITLGTMNVSSWMWNCCLTNLQNGTLNFQVSSGSALLNDQKDPWAWNPDLISANVQLSSPLTIATPEFGQSGLGGGASNGLEISGVVSGNNGITKTGPGTLWLTNTGNDFVGNIQIQDGILNVTNWAAIPSGDTLILGGDGTVGRLYLSSDTSAISRPIVLAGEGGEFFVTGWEGNGWPASAGDWTADATPTASTFTGVISGTGNLWIGQGYAATFQGTADNSYVGDTKVLGWANVLTTYRALNGNVSIEAGGRVDLASANNVDPTKSVYVGSFNMASPECNTLGILAVEGDFVPTLDPNSSGILSLLANMPGQMYEQGYTGPNINARLAVGAPQLGNGYMWIGAVGPPGNPPMGETFTGTSLQPDIDNVYRLYAGLTLAVNNDWYANGQGVLADVGGVSCSVEIGAPMAWGMEGVTTNDINTFTGSLTIDANAVFTGWAQSGGSPFGAATGNVYIDGGALQLASYTLSPAIAAKNNLNINGQAAIWLNANYNLASMSFTSIVRNNNAILAIQPWNGTLGAPGGTGDQLLVTGGVTNYDGGTMTAPYFVRYYGEGFLKYDAVAGFEDATFTATNGFGANNGTDIVNLTGNTVVGAGTNVWALRTAGSLTGGDITIGSGGLILAGGGTQSSPITSTTNINFGSAEGIIYSCGYNGWYVGWNNLAGTISGTNGLTIGAVFAGNGDPYFFLSADNSTTLFGQITIDNSIVKINSANALGASTNTVYINGGTGNNGNCVFGALATNAPQLNTYGTMINLYNPIVVGPNGGALLMEFATGYFSLYGPISGPGTLSVRGHPGDPAYLYNANNTWSGGTIVGGGLYVEPGSNLGPGNVLITDGWGYLDLLGTTNTNSTNNIALINTWGYTDSTILNVMAASETIGTLSGNGRVMLNAWQSQANTVLTFGNSESSDFYGIIQDCWTSNTGSLVYAGTGTFTMWGEGTYRGSTTINSGTFVVNGKIAGSGVTVNGGVIVGAGQLNPDASAPSGGTLTGTGCVATSVTVNTGGTLTGSLHVTGGVQVYGGTVNFTGATVDGGLYMDVGSGGVGNYGGSSTVNGYSESDGGTITGSHTFNGQLVLDSYDGPANMSGTNTINGELDIGYYGDTCSVSGNTTVNNPGGNLGIWCGSMSGTNTINLGTGAMWMNAWGYGPCSLSGTGTITAAWFEEWANSIVSGTYTFNSNVYLYGGTFQGNHTINGTFTTAAGSNAIVAPHNGATAGTMTIVGAVTLDHSTTLDFNLGTPGTIGGGINDLITITGSLSLDGTLNVTGLTGFGAGTYTLFTYTGMLTEPSGPLTLGTMPVGMGYTYTIDTSTTGQVNLDVVMPWQPGDTNHDGLINSLDIDAIYHNFGAPSTSQWKVDGDGNVVGQGDVTYELHTYFHTNYGDANLDTKTDFSDFQVLLDHWQVSGPTIGWAQGDFNGSYSVDFLDFQTLLDYWNPGGWSFAPAQTPEPATLTLLALGGLALLRRKK